MLRIYHRGFGAQRLASHSVSRSMTRCKSTRGCKREQARRLRARSPQLQGARQIWRLAGKIRQVESTGEVLIFPVSANVGTRRVTTIDNDTPTQCCRLAGNAWPWHCMNDDTSPNARSDAQVYQPRNLSSVGGALAAAPCRDRCSQNGRAVGRKRSR